MLSMCTTISVGFEAFICRPVVNILILSSLKPIIISLYCKQEQWKEPLTLWQLTESRWVFFALSHLLVTETENLEMQIPKPCKQFHLRQTFTSNYGIFVYHSKVLFCFIFQSFVIFFIFLHIFYIQLALISKIGARAFGALDLSTIRIVVVFFGFFWCFCVDYFFDFNLLYTNN